VAGLFERNSQVARYPNKKFSPLVLCRWLSVISLFEKLNKFLFCHKSIPRKAAGNKILLTDTLVVARKSSSLISRLGSAPACNRQHEKQHSTVRETQVGDGIAARDTQEGWNLIKSCEQAKNQREDSVIKPSQ
jgi:hypothetical protein